MPIIALSGGVAFLLAFLFTIMVGLCTTLIVYVFILTYISLTGFLSGYFLCYFISNPLEYVFNYIKLVYFHILMKNNIVGIHICYLHQ